MPGALRRVLEEKVTYARRVLEAIEAAEARGDGVIALDGQMIDAPVVARAWETRTLAEEGGRQWH